MPAHKVAERARREASTARNYGHCRFAAYGLAGGVGCDKILDAIATKATKRHFAR